jgi:peptide deformylase
MKTLFKHIFEAFKNKIFDKSYHPSNLIETFKAQLTATFLLQHADPFIVEQAQAFLQKTSHSKEADLTCFQKLALQIKSCREIQICSTYTNTVGTFLEYKIWHTTWDDRQQWLHFHAQYEMKNDQYYFISQTSPLIRVISDPILHQPGLIFPENPTPAQKQELIKQIELAKLILILTAGAGIAANQCAGIDYPYRFTIFGVFYDNPLHAAGVEKRYPKTKFPQAKILVNPVITAQSEEAQHFNHGCLSVPCGNRCTVMSPWEISVSYQDPLEGMTAKKLTCSGVDAVVLWHELTHILAGKTYMDVTFESLPIEELNLFQRMVQEEVQIRQVAHYVRIPCLTVPPFHLSVKINEAGIPRLDEKELYNALANMTDDTLAGLHSQLAYGETTLLP